MKAIVNSVIAVDRNYLPMAECSRRHAIRAVASGRALVLDLRSWAKICEISTLELMHLKVIVFPHTNMVPENALLGLGHGSRGVLKRDNYRCQYCGKRATTVDHVVPRCQGGASQWSNLVACCLGCNQHKSGRRPEEAGMKLIKPIQGPRAHLYQRFQNLVREYAA
jgi:hypothetical protein